MAELNDHCHRCDNWVRIEDMCQCGLCDTCCNVATVEKEK